LPKEQQKPSAKYHWEMHYLRPPTELDGRQPLWVSTPFLQRASLEAGNLVMGDMRFSLLYVDCEWLDEDALLEVLRLARKGLPVCLKRVPKRPGARGEGRGARAEYGRNLRTLRGLENVSSEFSVLTQEPPLVSGRDAPNFWCRVVDDDLLLFFGHPSSRGLTYPMRYGQAARAARTRRDVALTVGSSRLELGLEFEPGQSLQVRVSGSGTVEFDDTGYSPRLPVRGGRRASC